MSDSLRPHESQHTRPPCPSPTPAVHSDSRPSSQWCHPAISSSVVPFSSCPQSLPASAYLVLGETHGQRSLADYSPWGHKVWHDWVAKHTHKVEGTVGCKIGSRMHSQHGEYSPCFVITRQKVTFQDYIKNSEWNLLKEVGYLFFFSFGVKLECS